MRKLAVGMIAAGTLIATAPAMAQVHIEGPGVGVRVGPDRYDRGYDRRSYRSYERGCRTVTVRERMPNGTVITRTRERC